MTHSDIHIGGEMGTVATSFFVDVLNRIGAPVTDANLRAMHAWQTAEGGSAAYNPFNTTEPSPGDSNYNSFGNPPLHVRNYASQALGVAATVATLTNGHYATILGEFRRGNDGHAACLAVDGSPWGTHGAAATFLRIYGTPPTIPPSHSYRLIFPRVNKPWVQGSDVRQVQEALDRHGFHVHPDGIYGPLSQAAVRAFEIHVHLRNDGIVGPNVRAALGMPH